MKRTSIALALASTLALVFLAGRWIDLRMNEVRQSEPEQEVDE